MVLARHSEAVRVAIEPPRLLGFEVTQGWEPLCAFQDVLVPAGELFPPSNDMAVCWADSHMRLLVRNHRVHGNVIDL